MSFHRAIFFQTMNKPWVLNTSVWTLPSRGCLRQNICRLKTVTEKLVKPGVCQWGHIYMTQTYLMSLGMCPCIHVMNSALTEETAAALVDFTRWLWSSQQLRFPGENFSIRIDNTRKPHLTYIVSKQTHASLHIMLCTRHFACLEMGVWVTSQSTLTSGAHCNLVQDQRTRARIRSASFSLLEVSVTMINEQCVTIRPSFTPLCASSEL